MLASIGTGAVTRQVELIVRSLRTRLGEGFDAAHITAEVEEEFAAYSAARVTQFVPIFVERRVWARLCRRRSALNSAAGRRTEVQ